MIMLNIVHTVPDQLQGRQQPDRVPADVVVQCLAEPHLPLFQLRGVLRPGAQDVPARP